MHYAFHVASMATFDVVYYMGALAGMAAASGVKHLLVLTPS